MTAKRKEFFKKLGADYFASEQELVNKGEYESGPINTKWLMPACVVMCVATLWSLNRLTGMLEASDMIIWDLAIFAGALIVGTSAYNFITYLILRFVAHVPKDKMGYHRRFLRFECGCRAIVSRNNYLIAEVVPFIIFVVVPILLEFAYGNGWFLCYGVVMCTCQMMNVFYMIQAGVANEKHMIGIIPGSAEIRVYRLKSEVKGRKFR